MAMTIRVDPGVLQAKSYSIADEIDRIERELDTIEQQINSSKSYWEGDASNMHQKKYTEMQADIKSTMARLKQQPVHLLTMANLYNKTEYENRGIAGMLSSNVIG